MQLAIYFFVKFTTVKKQFCRDTEQEKKKQKKTKTFMQTDHSGDKIQQGDNLSSVFFWYNKEVFCLHLSSDFVSSLPLFPTTFRGETRYK